MSLFSECTTIESAKSRYKELALLLHPDRNPAALEIAHEAFLQLQQEYKEAIDRLEQHKRQSTYAEHVEAYNTIANLRGKKMQQIIQDYPNLSLFDRSFAMAIQPLVEADIDEPFHSTEHLFSWFFEWIAECRLRRDRRETELKEKIRSGWRPEPVEREESKRLLPKKKAILRQVGKPKGATEGKEGRVRSMQLTLIDFGG